jgi:molecular chaperone HscB
MPRAAVVVENPFSSSRAPVICWSCEKAAGADMFCAHCGAIQPADAAASHFQVLGVPQAFDVDLAALERRYKELTRQLHPDKFARADARARRASLQRTVQLNQAWKTLRDPVRRAEYLLSLAGIDVGTEEGTQQRTADGSKQKLPVPHELLMDVMELREGLMEARMAEDEARVAELAAEVRGRKQAAMQAVGAALRSQPADVDAAARELVAVRYFDRFLNEVDVHDDARADAEARSPSESVGHG